MLFIPLKPGSIRIGEIDLKPGKDETKRGEMIDEKYELKD
jgi:hypothetical protein